ncbi:MAG: GNAT family protein [Mycobacteriales bacterium]
MTWPLHALVLTTPTVELRGMTEADARALSGVVPEGLEHHPDLPDLGSPAKVLQAYWRQMGLWTPQDWVLPFAVHLDGEPIGVQALEAKDFAVRRTVGSYSWLIASARGRGHGKAMRAAVLELAFSHLGAQHAMTEAWEDNASSLGVSRALGYQDNGIDLVRRGDRVGRMQRLLLPAEAWRAPFPVEVSGLTACLPLLGS